MEINEEEIELELLIAVGAQEGSILTLDPSLCVCKPM